MRMGRKIAVHKRLDASIRRKHARLKDLSCFLLMEASFDTSCNGLTVCISYIIMLRTGASTRSGKTQMARMDMPMMTINGMAPL